MTLKIKEQILNIRRTGLCNMVDATSVRELATKIGYKELIDFINNNIEEYINFILFGN